MNKISKITLAVIALTCIIHTAFADRGGIGKKSKSKITLNITTPTTLKNSVSLNLKSGLNYSGSYLLKNSTTSNSFMSNTLITYQKGNTVYIIPYKQKIVVPMAEIKQGYTGMKLIITPKH